MLNSLAARELNDRQTHTHTDTQTGLILYIRPLTWEGKNALKSMLWQQMTKKYAELVSVLPGPIVIHQAH